MQSCKTKAKVVLCCSSEIIAFQHFNAFLLDESDPKIKGQYINGDGSHGCVFAQGLRAS